MAKLLYIVASPRAEASQSKQVADAYVAERRRADPALHVEVLDLWRANLPEFDGDKAAAKMTFFGVGEMDGAQRTAWDQVVEVTRTFSEADEYVFAVPMWNGGIPYKLKHYIDIITQPGLLFGFDPEQGYFGLLKNKKATVVYTAGVFAPGVEAKYGADFQSTYLEWWFNLVGIEEVNAVRFQPSLLTADPVAAQQVAVDAALGLATAAQ